MQAYAIPALTLPGPGWWVHVPEQNSGGSHLAYFPGSHPTFPGYTGSLLPCPWLVITIHWLWGWAVPLHLYYPLIYFSKDRGKERSRDDKALPTIHWFEEALPRVSGWKETDQHFRPILFSLWLSLITERELKHKEVIWLIHDHTGSHRTKIAPQTLGFKCSATSRASINLYEYRVGFGSSYEIWYRLMGLCLFKRIITAKSP